MSIIILLLWFQQRQRGSIEYFQQFFRENPTPMWVLDLETLGFLSVNHAAQKRYGYTKEEFKSLTLKDIRAESEQATMMEHVLLAEHETTLPQVLHRNSSGKEFYVSIQAFPTMFRGRRALVVQAYNIQDRIEAERQQHEYASRLEQTLESITDGFYAVNRDWNFSYVNRESERLLRFRREDLLGRNLWDMFPDARNSKFFLEYHRAMRDQVSVRFEEYYPAPLDGWFQVSAYPTPGGLAVYFSDITQRKVQEQMILAQNEKFREIAWIQSHKVRAPLARLMGLVQIINTDYFADPNNELLLKYLIKEAHELDTIVTEVVLKSHEVTPSERRRPSAAEWSDKQPLTQ